MAIDKILLDYRIFPLFDKFIKRLISGRGSTSLEEVELFTFVNKLGMYATYVLIEALRTFGHRHNSDELIKAWVRAAINPEMMLWEFSKLRIVENGLRRNQVDEEEDRPISSFYEVSNKTVFDRLRLTCLVSWRK